MPNQTPRPSATTPERPSMAFAASLHAGPSQQVPRTRHAGQLRARSGQGEEGSLVSEYGLIAVLGATITGVAISWAKGGAIATLLNVILRQVRALAGV